MDKEPIGLYIFRYVLGFALFAFMGMLYWSSSLVEDNLKNLRNDVSQLKNDVFVLREDAERLRGDILQALLNERRSPAIQTNDYSSEKTLVEHSKVASDYPNILQTDEFYDHTLPKLLGKNFSAKGIQHTASLGKPDNLHPFSNWAQVGAWNAYCNVSVSKSLFGKYETYASDMALKMEERVNPKTGVPEFWIFLRKDVYWQPLQADFFPTIALAPQFLRKNLVTAEDFKFYFDALMNPYVQLPGAVALRTYYESVEEIEVIDKHTFVVRWKIEEKKDREGKTFPQIKYMAKIITAALKPLASHVYKYFADGKKIIDETDLNAYRTNSVWAQNFATHWAKDVIVSCGPWIFDGMNERQIKFKRNPHFYDSYAALTSSMEIDLKDSPDTIWQEFKNGHLDSYSLQPQQLAEFNQFLQSEHYKKQKDNGDEIKRLDYLARTYTFIGWNESKPYFTSAKVRRALTMAIDRKRIIQQNLNNLGVEINGTFSRYSTAYDNSIEPWPFDPRQARHLLEEEGWIDHDGDGIIDKMIDGELKPFRFSITYYVKNELSKSICEYVATALKEIGIVCHLNGVDIADLSSVFDDKSFDALNLAWQLGTPPEDPRQLWHSSGAKEKGSSNAIGFANSDVDKIIDQLDYETNAEKRIALYHKFDAIIHQEQPYTFLYSPKIAFLYRSYLQNVFIPADRQDLVPGADVGDPDPSIFWIKSEMEKQSEK